MSGLLNRLLELHGPLVYAIVGLLVFTEDALFVGFVLPAEAAAVLGGVAAGLGHVSLPAITLVVVVAAIIGDTIGYEVGRRLGPRLRNSRLLRRHGQRLDQARDLLARRGGIAVFAGRFVAFLRATMPALAGAVGMPYLRFLAFNAAGGVVWGVGVVLLGYLAGTSYAAVERTAGRVAALTVAAVALIVAVIWRVRRRYAHLGGAHPEDETHRPST